MYICYIYTLLIFLMYYTKITFIAHERIRWKKDSILDSCKKLCNITYFFKIIIVSTLLGIKNSSAINEKIISNKSYV